MISPEVLHYLSIGIAISFGAIGAGIGQGIGAFGAINSMIRQNEGNQQTFKTMIIGLAFLESGVIFALVIALLTIVGKFPQLTYAITLSELGIAVMIGIASTAATIAGSMALKSSCKSIARQPYFAQKILTLMLIAMSIIEAPVIFSFIIGLVIRNRLTADLMLGDGLKFLAATICMGLGCISPSGSQARFSNGFCQDAGLNKDAFGRLFTFSIISQAVIETVLIFSLLTSILMIYMPLPQGANPLGYAIKFFAAALTITIGCAGAAIAESDIATTSCHEIVLEPDKYSVLFRTSILAYAFIESTAIYALIITLSLIVKSL